MEFDAEPALAHIERVRAETGLRITMTHFVAKVVADSMAQHPATNCVLRFGRIYPRQSIDVFLNVATDMKGQDLTGLVLRSADKMSLREIAQACDEKVEKIRRQGDPAFKQMKGMMAKIPGILAWPFIQLSGFLLYALNLWSPLMGVPRDSFGSVIVTNIGSLGLETGFAPLVPYSRVPVIFSIGAVHEKPWVIEGKVVPRKVINITATFDHRLIDGVHAGHMNRTIRSFFTNPQIELSPSPNKT
jgi:pyruvate dehydrogenase E2 component (dihydrolipoamide acetyltransferase)